MKKSSGQSPATATRKKRTDIPESVIAGRARNYTVAFKNAGEGFWDRVSAMRNMQRDKLEKQKTKFVQNTFEALGWRSHFPNPLSDVFVDAFVQSVRTKKFPKKRNAQARFLGESIGADGTVSPRRSRDICGQQSRKARQITENSPAGTSHPPAWWEPQADAEWRKKAWVAVYSYDASGVIRDYNSRAAELWGRKPEVGDIDERFCGSFRVYRPDGGYMPHDQCPMGDVLTGRVPGIHDGEVHIERPDGSRVPLATAASDADTTLS